jgi:hypothetical protein
MATCHSWAGPGRCCRLVARWSVPCSAQRLLMPRPTIAVVFGAQATQAWHECGHLAIEIEVGVAAGT